MNERENLEWDDRTEEKSVENERFSRPSPAIIAYARAHQLHGFNLWSKVVQRVIKLRMDHPEWEEERDRRRQEHHRLLGQPIICMLQMLSVGRVETVNDEILTLALADQSHEAADWLRSVLPRLPDAGLYRLPANFPFTLTYERSQAHDIELIMLPEHGKVKALEEA
jgi:hypothetical protein